jgi:Dyp-type peroxidase family
VAAGPVSTLPAAPELHDVQGIVARGYRDLAAARFLLVELEAAAAARGWVQRVAEQLTAGDQRPQDRAVQLALTSSGLRKLGLAPEVLALFSNEFVDGMAARQRSRILGDLQGDAPERWDWGGPTLPVDAALLLYARDPQALGALEAEQTGALPRGTRIVRTLETSDLQGYEPFGFRDGISQPLVEGLSKTGPKATTVRFGEFVLGYPNEHGRITDAALIERAPELGRNGSYLVLRQLSQDVCGFWRFVDRATQRPDGSSDPDRRVRLAAKLVGRWPSGAPLVLAPERDDPLLGGENEFRYFADDPRGVRCPVGAHIRRANPRDSLDPSPGTDGSLAINRRHRILRRGREYGSSLPIEEALDGDDAATRGDERGLHFICLNANIARQFEFVHFTWLNDPKFAGLYDDSDPIVSPSHPFGGTFTIPTEGLRERIVDVPRFVSVKGGAYFFLPGIAAARRLASL